MKNWIKTSHWEFILIISWYNVLDVLEKIKDNKFTFSKGSCQNISITHVIRTAFPSDRAALKFCTFPLIHANELHALQNEGSSERQGGVRAVPEQRTTLGGATHIPVHAKGSAELYNIQYCLQSSLHNQESLLEHPWAHPVHLFNTFHTFSKHVCNNEMQIYKVRSTQYSTLRK